MSTIDDRVRISIRFSVQIQCSKAYCRDFKKIDDSEYTLSSDIILGLYIKQAYRDIINCCNIL